MNVTERSDSLDSERTMAARRDDAHPDDVASSNNCSRDALVADHLRLVRSIAFRYRGFGLPVEDLVQEGSLGLLEAIDRFEPGRGADFEAYARFRIRRAIRTALTDQSRLIRLPKQIVERRRAIDHAEASLRSATGRTPTPAEVAAATGLAASALVAMRGLGTPPVSLDQPFLDDGSPLEASIADSSARDPENETVEREEVAEVDDAVAALPARQREIVTRHFGLGGDPEPIAEVAAELHVSQQRVRAIERDALSTLRDQLEPLVTPRPTR
jgi:RNA polymerase primary sigma factor